MTRSLLGLLLALVSLSGISGQETPNVPLGKEIWFNSAPDSIDMIEMYSQSEEDRYNWDELRPHIDVIHYYQGHAIRSPSANFKNNSYNILATKGFFRRLKETYKIKTSMEVGAIKWFACDWSKNELDEMVYLALDSTYLVNEAGGEVNYLTIDSSIPGGFECTKRNLSIQDIGKVVALWMKDVRDGLVEKELNKKTILIGDVEPYPYADVSTHKWYLDVVESESRRHRIPNFSHYHLDIDMRAIKDYQKMDRDLREIARYVKSKGMRFGIVMNGENTDSLTEYFDSINNRLVVMKSLGLLDLADNIVIQSWAVSSGNRQYLPPNLPLTMPYTQTNFTMHLLHCAMFKTPGWDCEKYPQPQ